MVIVYLVEEVVYIKRLFDVMFEMYNMFCMEVMVVDEG